MRNIGSQSTGSGAASTVILQINEEAIPGWLDSPNEVFGCLKPLEAIERGEVDRLWTMIYRLESGVPS